MITVNAVPLAGASACALLHEKHDCTCSKAAHVSPGWGWPGRWGCITVNGACRVWMRGLPAALAKNANLVEAALGAPVADLAQMLRLTDAERAAL